MIELEWNWIKARVWVGSLPAWDYPITAELERSYATPARQSTSSGCVAIELLLPRGPRALYGGLGAEFTADHSGILDVRLGLAQDRGYSLAGSLAGRLDSTHVGLIAEYADGVFQGVVDTDAPEALGAGTLRFARGVHGDIGSSAHLFRIMSRILLRVLARGDGDRPLEDTLLLELIQREVHWTPPSEDMT